MRREADAWTVSPCVLYLFDPSLGSGQSTEVSDQRNDAILIFLLTVDHSTLVQLLQISTERDERAFVPRGEFYPRSSTLMPHLACYRHLRAILSFPSQSFRH